MHSGVTGQRVVGSCITAYVLSVRKSGSAVGAQRAHLVLECDPAGACPSATRLDSSRRLWSRSVCCHRLPASSPGVRLRIRPQTLQQPTQRAPPSQHVELAPRAHVDAADIEVIEKTSRSRPESHHWPDAPCAPSLSAGPCACRFLRRSCMFACMSDRQRSVGML